MIQALGWTLVHFLWQGAAIALLLALANRALRRASAQARYVAACAALLLMLAAPVATFLRLSRPFAAGPVVAAASTAHISAAVIPAAGPTVPPAGGIPWLPLIVALWTAGVALLSIRMAGGLLVARRLKLRATPVASHEWRERIGNLAARIGLRRGVALCESALAEAPMTIGWLRPAILIPAGALLQLSPEQLEAILAHELAHVRRLDYLVNLLQTGAETLLFYHPAVWWVSRRIRAERENCCDDLAVAVCGDAVVYARALLELETMAAGRAPQMALAATAGSLSGRVKRLLRPDRGTRRNPGTGLAAVLAVFALATAWLCIQPRLHAASHAAEAAATAIQNSGASGQSVTATSQTTGTHKTPPPPPPPPPPPLPAAGQKPEPSYVREIAAAGYPHLSVNQLIAFKMQNVTPDYIRAIRAAGFTPSANQLLAMRLMGVTPAYAKQMKAAFPDITARELIACHMQGIDPQTAKQMNSLGLGRLSVHQMIAARIFKIDAATVRSLESEGFRNLTFQQVVGARVQGVTPEFVRGLKAAGFPNLTMRQAIAARVQGLTPEYVSSLRNLGFPKLTFEEALRAKVMGLTPAFVREARQHGFQNLTIDKLIRLKMLNVLPGH
jgi:beta-lactamase regulating signal transducer with metallopeptidase domain